MVTVLSDHSNYLPLTNIEYFPAQPIIASFSFVFMFQERGSRSSVSNESNVLLDPEVIPDLSTQALVLTVLATLVKYTTDENETRVLYQYLAEGSVVFPRVFPVM